MMQWESPRNESFTRREVRQVHTISGDGYTTRIERQYSESSKGPGEYVNGNMMNGTESLQQRTNSKRTIYMMNGDSNSESKAERFPYKKCDSDTGTTGSLQQTFSTGSFGRKSSSGSVSSTGSGTKISSITMPIRSSSFSTGRRISSGTELPVLPASSSKTESSPTKPTTLPRTSSLIKKRTPSDPRSGLPDVNVKYNIKMKIGEIKGNGADGNVYIQLFGSKGSTAKIQLRQAGDEKNRFEKDQEYKFMVTTLDIGKVERIKLSHDHMEYGTGLHVKEVEVDVPSYGNHYTFPCNCWLAQDRLMEMTVKDLNSSTPTPNKGYTVSVRLGKVLDPYIKLYLQLCGENEESTKIVLRPSGSAADTFQEGKTYMFSVEMPNIGKVERIRVGHDSHGSGRGIFLDDIEVTPDEEDPLFFPCSCWLAEDIDDGKMEREIYPGTRTPHTSDSDATHTVSVHLGEVLNPEATLYIYLIGQKGETSKVFLRPEEPLEREKTYKFTLALTVDIGKIEKIRLGQDSRGYGKGLFVDSVRVSPVDSDPISFPCACWLAEDVWDSKTERELLPGKAVRRPENVAYSLTFKTGDMPYAGTDANVTLQLFGDKGQTEKIMLRQELGKTLKRFDRGRTDRFTVQTMDVGKVERIRLSHDNSGPNPEWYLEFLRIEIPDRNEKYFFPCNRWLTGDEDRRVEVDVYPVDENVVQEEQITITEEHSVESPAPEPEPEPEPEMAEYKVSFRLGEVLDPYTKLHMVIHGDKGDTDKIYLTPKGGRLEPGKLYTVTVTTADVGNVRNISLGQDNSSPNQGVFVEEVEISAPDRPQVVFPCRCWLAEDEDDGLTTRVLVPGQSLSSQYNIGFRLGEVLDPDTKLYMVLQGDKGESGRIYLLPDGSKFEPDKFYKVSVNIKDIGKIEKVHIGHDSKGRNKGVFIEEIEVTAADVPKVVFPCRCWLAESEDDGKTSRVLAPGESIMQPYDIAFRLGEVQDPRAKLYMILHGKNGESPKIYLTPTDGKKFEPGRLYTVSTNLRDIGPVVNVSIGNESRGPGHGVFLEEIEVAAPNEEAVVFPCRCWLAEDKGDGKTSRVLEPGETFTPQYDILFRLGDVYDPQAKLYMILYGDRGESGKIYLTPSDGTKFESGKQYSVSVNIKDIGKINKVYLGNDSRGHKQGVFVEEIEIRFADEEPVIFPCRCWLAEDEGDGKTARVLVPGETIQPQLDSTLYNMTFETAEDVPFAGTDATVYVQLVGEKGQTEKIEFKNASNLEAPKFKRGRIDKFAVETVDVGQLNKIRVGHDNTGRNPEWYLKKLTIEVPSRDETYIFEYNNWIVSDEVELDPVDEKTRTELYTIHLKLGDVADPNAPVWIKLEGEKGESGQIQIKPGYGPQDKFEKDRTYKVVARVADIGRITDVKVGQELLDVPSKGLYVKQVVVTASRGEGVVFPVNCWTGEEEKLTVEDVPPTGAEGPLDTTYQVTFKTGDRPNGGTSAKVLFELFGDQGKTEPIQLSEDRTLRLFERGNSDKFKVDTRDVGKIEKLRVGHDNSGRDPDWYLEEVTIDVPDKGEQYIFPCHRWLLGSQRDVDLFPAETKDFSHELDYRITLKTGDEKDAGTDANVYLQMFGEKGKTQTFALREEGDKRRFEKGRMDKFLIRTLDIGMLNSVRISRDNSGTRPGWLLDRLTIDVDEKDEHYVFYCNRWIRDSDTAEFTPEQGALHGQEGMYTVAVKVGDVLDPDVNPFYQIIGRKGETSKIRLREGYSRSHVFTKGNTYKVSVKSPDMGEIIKLRIGDDGCGRGRTLFVEEVTVTNKQGDSVVFPCRCWLGKDEANGAIVRELIPGEPVPAELEDISYQMTIKTGDKANAGTDANVYFSMHGDKGETPRIGLQDETQTFRRFERSRADKFVVQTADVGKLKKLVIGHDNAGQDPSWFLDEVDIDIPVRDEHYKFRLGDWIGGSQPGQRKEVVLFPVDDIEGIVPSIDIEDLQQSGAAPSDSDYDVEFKTSADENAGTDANVFFQLIGEDGESQEIFLKNAEQGYFLRGQLDRFRVQAKDVGRLTKLRVGHDNSGSYSKWLLDEVVVFSRARGERYVFKCGRWIGGSNNGVELPLDSWNHGQLVGQEPDIPDLIEFMQSGDDIKVINAAGYLQHLCYSKENVKDKVRELGGIRVIVRLLRHPEWRVRYAAICLLRNLSFSLKYDANRMAIADCGGIEVLIEILQETEKTEYRAAILGVLCNLSSVESLRRRILNVCLHIIVTLIIIPYSEWTVVAARNQPPAREQPWPAVLVHATRLVRNLSSAGTIARQELRDERDLVDCLVWIIRIGVKNEQFDNKCLEHSVCTLRNLSYRLESEIDRSRYDDADVDVDPAAVKEQQSQGCFAGCGGKRGKRVPNEKKPMDRPKGSPQGTELIWQPQTIQQYYALLRKSKNVETLEGSAGALHNLTACSWKWAIKIRGDTRKAQAIPHIVELLKIDYDPTIRAAAIALRNLCVDSENKRTVGEKGMINLAQRLPTGEEEMPRLVQDPTVASLLCTIYQLTNKNDKNAKYLRKTKGIQRMVKIATDQDELYSPRVVKIANQVLANLWSHSQLQQEIKREGWQNNAATQNAGLARAPMDYEATSLPRTPEDRQRLDPNTRRFNYDSPQFPRDNRRTRDTLDNVNSETEVTDMSLESDRHRGWGEGLSQLPPPYASDDSNSRGSRSRDDIPMEEVRTSSRASGTNSLRDENFNANDRTIRLRDSVGGGGKDEDLWV